MNGTATSGFGLWGGDFTKLKRNMNMDDEMVTYAAKLLHDLSVICKVTPSDVLDQLSKLNKVGLNLNKFDESYTGVSAQQPYST